MPSIEIGVGETMPKIKRDVGEETRRRRRGGRKRRKRRLSIDYTLIPIS